VLRSSEFPVQTAPAWGATRWALGIGLIALLAVFAPTWIAMVKVWANSETYGHGMAVAPIAAWLIWRQRAQLTALTPSVSWVGVAGLAVCCFGWLAAELAGINVVTQFAFTGMLVCLALALTGWSVAKAMAFPLLFLFFMVPAGEALNPPLMDGTANATVWALQVSGIPVYREGMNFALPTGRWSVVEACSGLRYVLAAGMLGALFAYLNFERWSQRIAFFGASIAVAVVANWMRAYLIVLVGHFSQMKWGVGDDHVVYGWVFFGLTMFVLFWMGAKWRDSAAIGKAGPSTLKVSGGAHAPFDANVLAPRTAKGKRRAVLAGALVCIGLTHFVLSNLRDVTPRTDFEARAIQTFPGLVRGPIAVQPQFSGARATIQGVVDPEHSTEIYLAYFARQEDGAEMIAFGNAVLPDTEKGWQVLSRSNRIVAFDGQSATVSEWHIRQGSQERLAWSWYTIGGVAVASEYKAKALTAWAMLTGKGDHSVVTVMDTRLRSTQELSSTRSDAQSFDRARDRLIAVAAQANQVIAR
jgi:exosortase A